MYQNMSTCVWIYVGIFWHIPEGIPSFRSLTYDFAWVLASHGNIKRVPYRDRGLSRTVLGGNMEPVKMLKTEPEREFSLTIIRLCHQHSYAGLRQTARLSERSRNGGAFFWNIKKGSVPCSWTQQGRSGRRTRLSSSPSSLHPLHPYWASPWLGLAELPLPPAGQNWWVIEPLRKPPSFDHLHNLVVFFTNREDNAQDRMPSCAFSRSFARCLVY